MKHLVIPLLLFSSPALAEDWLHPPTVQSMPPEPSFYISPNAFIEVPASALERALDALAKDPLIHLSPAAATNYTRGHLSCAYPEQAYLVRAAYENEATGAYSVKGNGKSLWVSHGSLGPASGTHRSALVVCLSFKPETVFVTTSGAL